MKSKTLRFYSLSELFGVQLVRGLNVEHSFPRHMHSSFVLGMIEQGERLLEIRGEPCRIKAGECFILHPHEPHRCKDTHTGGHDYWTLSIPVDAMRRIFEEIRGVQTAALAFSQNIICDPAVFQGMQQFVASVEHDAELVQQELLFRDLMYACATLDRQEPEPVTAGMSYAVARVREYLEQHFDETIRLEELADVGRISPFYLSRIFQREFGVPPYEYLIKIRLKQAQIFLREGESIAGAAYRAGFADQSHFTRFFKRHMGLTPGEFIQAGM